MFSFTDSICYLHRPGLPDPPVGSHLGCLSNQLFEDYGPKSFCTEFVSAGAKNYAYKVAVGGDLNNIKTVIKVRGISINSSCSDVVTFENLKQMVFREKDLIHVQIPHRIERVPNWKVVTRSSAKKWRVCVTKRRRINVTQTVPYGYKGSVLDQNDYELLDMLDSLLTEED